MGNPAASRAVEPLRDLREGERPAARGPTDGRGSETAWRRDDARALQARVMEDRANSSLVALRRILRAAENGARELARQTQLSTPQLIVMQIVEEAQEATPKTISQRAGIAQATATALLDKLERRGYVTRRRGQSDRRQVWIALTEEGREALSSAPDPLQERFAERFLELSDWEQAMIVAALERVAGLLDAEKLDAAPVLHVGALTPGEIEPR
jgi:DNA-binding MarR family transcriptional regulator